MTKTLVVIGLVLITIGVNSAQVISLGNGKCTGKIYHAKDVTQRAHFRGVDGLTIPRDALEHNVHGQVIINAVFCRNGQVTDMHVVNGLPFGVTEAAMMTLLNLPFTPAEMNFHSVSQAVQFRFNVNQTAVWDAIDIDPALVRNRLIEEIDVMGNRRLTKEQIFEWIKSRPGDSFSDQQTTQDLQAILKTGYFDKLATRVTVEDAVRGGVRVMFEVKELPIIAEIRIEGLKERDQSAVLNELDRQGVDLRKGTPFDPVKVKRAMKVIEDFFQSQGWSNIKTDSLIENVSATEVRVFFKISGRDF
jgi:hypothetical protein